MSVADVPTPEFAFRYESLDDGDTHRRITFMVYPDQIETLTHYAKKYLLTVSAFRSWGQH
jgi:hypothetical protein